MKNQLNEKNKEKLKKKVIFDLVKTAIALILALLIFFLPIFSIEGLINFSLFDSVKEEIEYLTKGNISAMTTAIFSIFIIIELIVLLVCAVIETVKKISILCNFNQAVIGEYDSVVDESAKKTIKKANVAGLLYALIIFVIANIIFSKVMGKVFSQIPEEGSTGSVVTLMSLLTTVSVFPTIVVAIVLIAFIVFAVLSKNIEKSIKQEYLKEKYAEEKAQEKTAEPEQDKKELNE